MGSSPTAKFNDESRFRRLVESLNHAVVWEFDVDANSYTFVSEHSELVLGYACTAWMADPKFLEHRTVEEERPKLSAVFDKLVSGDGNDLRLEHRVSNSEGIVVWLHTGIHREVENGRLLLRGVTVDVNSIKLAEERERAAKEEAERTTHAYEELLAIITHDLRSPLQSFRLGASALRENPELAARVVPALLDSTEHMERLIEDLHDLAQIRTRKLKIIVTEAHTHDLVRETVERYERIAGQKKVTLLSSVASTVLLRCDARRIAQVLGNLVSNAIKFTGERGSGTVLVGVANDPLDVVFRVEDDGPGVDPAHIEKVFERAWQASGAAQGSGLGLYIAKNVVEAHGGRIWVEHSPSGGAVFQFTIPRT